MLLHACQTQQACKTLSHSMTSYIVVQCAPNCWQRAALMKRPPSDLRTLPACAVWSVRLVRMRHDVCWRYRPPVDKGTSMDQQDADVLVSCHILVATCARTAPAGPTRHPKPLYSGSKQRRPTITADGSIFPPAPIELMMGCPHLVAACRSSILGAMLSMQSMMYEHRCCPSSLAVNGSKKQC